MARKKPLFRSIYKSPAQLQLMIDPGKATAAALKAMRQNVAAGVSLLDLDRIAEEAIIANGGKSNFQLEPGYRHTICANVNEHVVHGIPLDMPLRPGDIVALDAGAVVNGWHGDAAFTAVIPDSSRPDWTQEQERLSAATEEAMWRGIARLATAKHLGEVGEAIGTFIAHNTPYAVLEDYIGHGIGRSMHEDPPVFNVPTPKPGPAVKPGLVVAIEPIISAGAIETFVEDDGWTVTMADGSMSAQWEHTVAVHDDGIWVLTAEDGGAAGLEPHGVVPRPFRTERKR